MESAYLASYLPRIVGERLADTGAITEPELRARHGIVMLCDMQGFTPRVERATQDGDLEGFNTSIQRYFCEQINAIYGQGGDILAFAGDSVLSFWPCDDNAGLTAALRRAVSAAFAIQARMSAEEPTRIGIGAGELTQALVGGHEGRWELLLSGPALREAIDAERDGEIGGVVLSFGAWQLLSEHCTGTAREGGHFLIKSLDDSASAASVQPEPAATADFELVHPFVPGSVLHGLALAGGDGDRDASLDEWLMELRTISVLMIGPTGIGIDSTRQLEDAHGAMRHIQQITHQYGGSIRISFDNKGFMVACYFGLPPQGSEHHAHYALRAGLEIRTRLQALGVHCDTAVATGRALCRAFGNELRRGYESCGEVVNRAARLMHAGTADVLCDETTYQFAQNRMQFEALPPIPVKGSRQQIAVYRPRSKDRPGQPAHARPMCRLGQRERLRLALTRLLGKDERSVIVLEGEPGMGKSTLAGEVAEMADVQGLTLLTASSDALEVQTPYWPWRLAFRQLAEERGGWERLRDEICAEDGDVDGEELRRIFPLLGDLLGQQLPETSMSGQLRGDVRARNTARLALRIIEQAAKRCPLVLIVEDLHWMDSRSRSLLLDFAALRAPILLLITTRPEGPATNTQQALRELPGCEYIELGRMESHEIIALSERQLGIVPLPPRLADMIVRKSGGNPFFCRELLRVLQQKHGQSVDTDTEPLMFDAAQSLPTTIEGLILERLDQLQADDQLCLKSASVFGRRFGPEALASVLPIDKTPQAVRNHIAASCSLGLVDEEKPEPEPAWAFHHAITRDVAYSLLTGTQRRALHTRAAGWFEGRYAENPAPVLSIIAHHFEQAGNIRSAATYLDRAAEQALRSGGFQEARKLFERLLDWHRDGRITVEPLDDANWRKGLGLALYFLGDLNLARSQFESVVEQLGYRVPSANASAGSAMLAAAARQVWHLGRRPQDDGVGPDRQRETDILADCHIKLGQIYFLCGEDDRRILHIALQGLNIAENAMPTPQLAHLLVNAAVMASLAGLRPLADRYLERAHAIVTDMHQLPGAAYVWHISAVMYAQRGDWQHCIDANNRAMVYIREMGDSTLEAEACVVRSTASLCQGDLPTATPAWERGLMLARLAGNRQVECWCLLDQCESQWQRGDLDAAADTLELALAVETEPADGSSRIEKLRMTALIRHNQGRLGEALAACDEVCRMTTDRPPSGYHWVEFMASAIGVYLDILEHGRAEDPGALQRKAASRCVQLRRLARRFGNVRFQDLWLRGRVAALNRRPAKARKLIDEAMQIASQARCAYDEGRALLAIERHGLGSVDASEHNRICASLDCLQLRRLRAQLAH